MSKNLDINITLKKLLLFALPTIIGNIFMNIYGSLDGFFVARFIDTNSLSAINIVIPIVTAIIAVSTMLSAGGSALISKKIGETKIDEARQNFTLLTLVTFIVSLIISILIFIFLEPILYLLGADDALFPLCKTYAMPIFICVPFSLLGVIFQHFFIVEGKPNLGLFATILGGIVNTILDILLLGIFKVGIIGSSISTGIGYVVPALIGFIYYCVSRKNGLFFVKPKWDFKALIKICSNGSSEMIMMLSSCITMIAINNILMNLEGPDGVAAVSIIYTVQGILTSFYVGYSSGIAPIISYNYGKKDNSKLKKVYKNSLIIIFTLSMLSFLLSLILASPLVSLFAKNNYNVHKMAVFGFRIAAIGFLFMGFNGFASSMFTAFNDGRTSAVLSFFRTFVFLIISLYTLPYILGTLGVWLSIPFAELLALFMSIYYYKKN